MEFTYRFISQVLNPTVEISRFSEKGCDVLRSHFVEVRARPSSGVQGIVASGRRVLLRSQHWNRKEALINQI